MAGILNPKTRFMDTFLTQVGRSQSAHWELRFSFATFSDYATFYEADSDNPKRADEAVDRIFFEAHNRPQDQVIPEFDDDGQISFPAGEFELTNGSMLVLSGAAGATEFLAGDALVTSASTAFTDCVDSLKDMQPLRSSDPLRESDDFKVSKYSHEFLMTDTLPIPSTKPRRVSLQNVESLWQDKKLTHIPNFQFMSPINKTSGTVLRDYPKLQQPAPLNFEELMVSLGANDPSGETGVGEPLKVTFPETSKENNLVCQVFEVCSGSVNKLRVIDFGEFEDEDPFSPGKHVFFVGKLFRDDGGEDTFINLFTVIFD
ncbi:hypothetical protein CMI47_14620 [Candidatus Pacearchaeota archaeon]|jgi:hypothetical protein|nr:hypothetical protein [Candidatus Pacearchaeota archaeon]|tara:strand:- start:15529 stop:16476 length:948 start_codon:yes stop_codon:yes gene_type:complete